MRALVSSGAAVVVGAVAAALLAAWPAPPLVVLAGSLAAGMLVAAAVVRTKPANARDPAAAPSSDGVARVAYAGADLNPDAMVVFDDDGLIRYANPAARELFFEGRDPEGTNFLRALGEAPAALREALLGDSDRLLTLQLQQHAETYHVTRRTVDRDACTYTLLVVKPLTREVARREVGVLKNVVRVMSHEVNNSLAPIASLVHSARLVAQRPEHADKLRAVFDTIEERAKHLHAFIDGYAGLARLPAPQPQPVEWPRLFEQVHLLYPAARLPEPPAQSGWFDAVQIEQVLINLVKNAIEAGSAVDQVEVVARVEADGSTSVEVRDRGPGFTQEALASALLPFYTTKKNGGGMGLALCREIVEAHGGTLTLANREGGGAMVIALLPGRARGDGAPAPSRARLTLSRV
jgi:nitrogen fixation/metabolism regulation signal transduction histidine kinase